MESRIRKPGLQRGTLSREAIVNAGLEILEREGAGRLTMRRLAEALGVEAMSLYNHVRDKRDLLDGVASLVLSSMPALDPTLPLRQRLEARFMNLYDTLTAHPWLVMMLATEQAEASDPLVLVKIDETIGELDEAGFPLTIQVSAFRGMMSLCFGFVLTHTLGLQMPLAEAEAHWAHWDSGPWETEQTPYLARLAPTFLDTRPRDDVRFMLGAFLDSLESLKR